MRKLIALILATLFAAATNAANNPDRVTVADFSSMQAGQNLPPDWESITISSIPQHTQYTLKNVNDVTVLHAESSASMSGVARKADIDPHATPWLQWRWRTSQLNEKSQLGSRAGDDFPVRIYVFFDYDIMLLPFFKRVIVRIARALYGERLPLAALCYVWTEDDLVGTIGIPQGVDAVNVTIRGCPQTTQVSTNVSELRIAHLRLMYQKYALSDGTVRI